MDGMQMSGGDDATPVDAGSFVDWISNMRLAIRGESDADVPCGSCKACCTSSQFIHIAPDEDATLRRIPKALLFRAPGFPVGHLLLGFTNEGHCPMFVDNRCSIYEDRPRTCRTYDCRIFTATAVDASDDGRVDIARRTRAWQFTTDESGPVEVTLRAMKAAATFIRAHKTMIPPDLAPATATQLAVMAFAVHELFVAENDDGTCSVTTPQIEALIAALVRRRNR